MPAKSSPLRSIFYLGLLGVVLITIAFVVRSGLLARKNPGRPINANMRAALAASIPQFSTEDAMLLAQTYGTAKKLPSGLRYIERAPGTGNAGPRLGGEVIVHYDGRLLDGTPFDSSYKRGVPFTFRLGLGTVIAGWDEGVQGMQVGGVRKLTIPPDLGYGARGAGGVIPPNATLMFEVELLAVA